MAGVDHKSSSTVLLHIILIIQLIVPIFINPDSLALVDSYSGLQLHILVRQLVDSLL